MSGRRSFLPYPSETPGGAGEGGGAGGAASGNYAAIDRGVPANTSAAPTLFAIAAIVLTPTVSGIFRVNAHVNLTDSSSESVTLTLLAAEQGAPGVPITLTGGTPAAQFGTTALAAGDSLGDTSTVSGTPIALVGATAAKTLAVKTISAVATDPTTVGTSGLFSFSVGGTSKIPFVLGETCVLYLALTAAAGTLSGLNVEFSAEENGSV